MRGGGVNDGTIILDETPDVRIDSYRETKFEYTETIGNASKSVSIDTYMTNEELVALCRELFTVAGEVDA